MKGKNINFRTLILNLTLCLIIGIFLTANSAQAKEVVFGGELNFEEQTENRNYYFSGLNIDIKSDFPKDLILTGLNIYAEGTVEEDVLVLGGDVYLNNYIKGDLRIIGGSVDVASTIEGDLIIIGGRVNLLNEANIKGETLIIGGKINQNANLENETNIIAASVNLNNEISGQTEITTQNIIFDSEANITGVLYYYAPTKALERLGFQNNGRINFNQISTIRETGFVKTLVINVISFWLVVKFVTTLILAFFLIYVFKVFAQSVSNIATKSTIKSFLTGFFSLILAPIIFVLLSVSLIGLPIGFLLLFVYIIIWSLASAVSGIFVGTMGSYVLEKNPEKKVLFSNTVLGVVLLTVIQFVPYFGDLTILILNFIAVGAIIRYINQAYGFQKKN